MVDILNSDNVVFKNIVVRNSRHAGIAVRTSNANDVCHDITIEDCEVHNTRTHGIVVAHTAAQDGAALPGTPHLAENITIRNNKVSGSCTAVNEPQARYVVQTSNGFDKFVPTTDPNAPLRAQGEAIRVSFTDSLLVEGNTLWNHNKECIDIINCPKPPASQANAAGLKTVRQNWIKEKNPANVYRASGVAIYVDGSSKGVEFLSIYNNVVQGPSAPTQEEGSGIVLGSEQGGYLKNVYVYQNVVSGMYFHAFCMCGRPGGGTAGSQSLIYVFHNTFVGNPGQFVVRIKNDGNEGQISDFKFENNVVCRTADDALHLFRINLNDWSELHIDHNHYHSGSTTNGALGTNAQIGDPKFEPAFAEAGNQQVASDFGIKSDSPLRDFQGVPNVFIAGLDIQLILRDVPFDIGAFEYDD